MWANVLPGGGASPFIFFTREPTVLPYWDPDAADLPPLTPGGPPRPTHSRAEWFANLYSAFQPGFFCWELYRGPSATGSPEHTCTSGAAGPWNGNVTNISDSWFVEGGGPNDGYVPFSYDDDPPGTTFTVRWTFDPSGAGPTVFKDATFRTLNGADPDLDGVGANEDSCPDVKGNLANGCVPGVLEDPDQDGVYGAADLCPNTAGEGALNGCPGGIIPNPPPPPPPPPPPVPKTLVATLLTKQGAVFRRASLARGAPVKFECTLDSAANGTLSISKKVATALGIRTKRNQKTVGIAAGKGPCKAVGGGSLKLKLLRAYAGKVKNAKKPFPASLAVRLTAPGQIPVTAKRGVKVR